MPGSLVLLGGEPGIGKSTLLLRPPPASRRGATAGADDVLYATGEESAGQVRLRADRLGLTDGAAGERDPGRGGDARSARIVELARAGAARPAHRRLDPDA